MTTQIGDSSDSEHLDDGWNFCDASDRFTRFPLVKIDVIVSNTYSTGMCIQSFVERSAFLYVCSISHNTQIKRDEANSLLSTPSSTDIEIAVRM